MNTPLLKITAAAVLALAVIVVGFALWLTQTRPPAQSKDTKHLQKEIKHAPKIARHNGRYLKDLHARKPRTQPPISPFYLRGRSPGEALLLIRAGRTAGREHPW